MLRPTIYYILAGPAFFLPFAYLCVFPALFIFPGAGPVHVPIEAEPSIREALWGTMKLGYVATLVQWPFYLVWAALSRETTPRVRLVWVVLIVVGNMLAMPLFLYAKFTRNIEGLLLTRLSKERLRKWLTYGP